jgi:hypothetical protein
MQVFVLMDFVKVILAIPFIALLVVGFVWTAYMYWVSITAAMQWFWAIFDWLKGFVF